MGADPSAFAWEWLRRTAAYRTAWDRAMHSGGGTSAKAHHFGLEQWENPAIAIPSARPIWSNDLLPDALTAHLADVRAPRSERLDLRLLAPLVTISIDEDATEHLLLSDGRHFLRIDIVSGTLIGCPASLTYLLHGVTALRGPLASLAKLCRLVGKGRFDDPAPRNPQAFRRWILELRVADALAAGCEQKKIARTLYGPVVSDIRWRRESAPYRRRVQRLVAQAQRRLNAPRGCWLPMILPMAVDRRRGESATSIG